jgi:hypothetical protein
MQELISLITDEIADKVQNLIKVKQLFNLNDKAELQLNQSRDLVNQGKKIL